MSLERVEEQDRKALAFILRYTKQHGRAPSYAEVGQHLGLSHTNNAKRNCDRLVARGLLKTDTMGKGEPGRPRAMRAVELPAGTVFPYRGSVSCGEGAEPEDLDELIDLRTLLKGGAAVFRAKGTSMIEAQIADGDFLLVSENPSPPTGAVVIAMRGEEMLCKRLARKTPVLVRLEPKNASLPAQEYHPDEIRFLGVLRTVLRRV